MTGARAVRERLDDLLVGAAVLVVASLCLLLRYLPMVDLPQHYAMVSILVHHGDPAYDFARRYTFDFLGRPYATVYVVAAALAQLMPLGAAMRIVVAGCTVAPLVGAQLLLAAAGRPRVWLLPAVPFAFGSLWFWGFLNFLLGTGLLLAALALVIVRARRRTRANAALLCGGALLILFTHFHSLVMLLSFAPVVAWAFAASDADRRPRMLARVLWPLVPGAAAGAAFVLTTWSRAHGTWARVNPGAAERVRRFGEFLGGGLPAPWPLVWLGAFVAVAAVGFVLVGDARPPSRRVAAGFGAILAAQLVLYFALPLNTNTATYVSARHALLCLLFTLPLLPALDGVRRAAVRALAVAVCALSLVVVGHFLVAFDAEARSVDPVLAALAPNQRLLPLMFDRTSRFISPTTFPYLHFGAYAQAARGGDLSHSFATVWNVPIRYRDDYHRYVVRDEVEWVPQLVSPEDVAHFDAILIRSPSLRRLPFAPGLQERAHAGPWTLLVNPGAVPDELPPR